MSNSSLVNCTVKSPNHSGKRTHTIDRITPHCVVGQLSAENIGKCFINSNRKASCNYGIGADGRICLIVDEENRSWCSSSNANDQRAVTIEIASDKTAPYAFKDAAYNGLVDLCEDICRRNGKKKLLWIEDKNTALNYNPKSDEMLLTVHRWFANKSCPGDWMFARMGNLATEVTRRLEGTVIEAPQKQPAAPLKDGDVIKLKAGATYYNGKSIPSWIFNSTLYYRGKNNQGIIFSTQKTGAITGIVSESSIESNITSSAFKPYKIRVTVDALNIRKGPSAETDLTGVIRDRGLYTIIDQSKNWGKLKSNAGWICLDYTEKV